MLLVQYNSVQKRRDIGVMKRNDMKETASPAGQITK